jgi:hypothetical protein
MSGANLHRGEVPLTLGGRALTLRPSFAALVAIERGTGLGLMQLAYRLGCGAIEHLPAIICEGARAAGETIETAEIEAAIEAEGMLPALRAAGALLANALGGGTSEKNAGAAEATTG